jgi:hypothetical protein
MNRVAAAATSRAPSCFFTCKPSAELFFALIAFLSVTCFTIQLAQGHDARRSLPTPAPANDRWNYPAMLGGSLNSSSLKLFHYKRLSVRPSVRVSVCTSVQPSGLGKQASAELSKQEHSSNERSTGEGVQPSRQQRSPPNLSVTHNLHRETKRNPLTKL